MKKRVVSGHIRSASVTVVLLLAALVLTVSTANAAMVSAPMALSGGTPIIGITCPTASQCTATTRNQALTFNPLASTRPWVRNPFSGLAMPIISVWCPQAQMCVTITGQAETTFNPHRFKYHAARQIEPVTGEGLIGVRCPSPSECVFIDSFGDGITYNPLTGKVLHKRLNVEGNERLTALACPSTTECIATDDDGTEITFQPVTGKRLFRSQIDPAVGLDAPSGASYTQLNSVSCSTTRRCAAIDTQGGVVVFDPLGFTTPTVTSFTTSWNAISCRPTGLCVAVGSGGQAVTGSTLAPGSWATQTVTGAADLNAVACPTATECVAADSHGNAFLINPSAAMSASH